MNKFIVSLFFFFLLLISLFVSGVIDSQDGFQYLAVARHIYYKGEPTAPTYEYDSRKNVHMSTIVAFNGKTYSLTGLGYSVAMVPAVAVTDLFYKIYDIKPVEFFPLENDWLILFTASFTNAFFGAGIGVLVYLYLRNLNVPHRQAVVICILSIFTTNLFSLSKHLTAHVMFTFFVLLSFYLIKLHSISKKWIYIILSGVSFGIVIITYNLSFILIPIPLGLYYLILNIPKFRSVNLTQLTKDGAMFLAAIIPFIIIFLLFEKARSFGPGTAEIVASYTKSTVLSTPISILIEGMYAQLLSPGRSIFIYSPLLIIPFIFWHKIRKEIRPELIAYIILFISYIVMISTTWSDGGEQKGIIGLWHGETSWGPRYLSPLIPFGMLIVGHIYSRVKKVGKLLVFLPLALVGLYVEILGVLLPYQIKFHELEPSFYVNKTQYTVSVYSNLLPRYNPIFMMSKKLVKLIRSFPETINNGYYNVRFYDGIDFAFNVGQERWRVIEGDGYILFDKPDNINEISFDLINHPIKGTKYQAASNFYINGQKMFPENLLFKVGERKVISIKTEGLALKEKDNELKIVVKYPDPEVIFKDWQIFSIIDMGINGTMVNKESIDVPYVSALGPAIVGVNYKNWGGLQNDGWRIWDIHTQTFERLPDFWWVRNLYYWDIPKTPLVALFIVNVLGVVYFGKKVLTKKQLRD